MDSPRDDFVGGKGGNNKYNNDNRPNSYYGKGGNNK